MEGCVAKVKGMCDKHTAKLLPLHKGGSGGSHLSSGLCQGIVIAPGVGKLHKAVAFRPSCFLVYDNLHINASKVTSDEGEQIYE